MKLVIESCTSINVGILQKAIRKTIDRDFPDFTEEEIFQETERQLNSFTTNNQTFKYTHIRNKLGGFRWFFICPKCETRVGKLFLPPEGSGNRFYWCKSCHHLKNQSAVMGQNKFYRNVTRPLKKMHEIEARLERGHLSSEKIQQLLDEYDAIEKNLKTAPEYRYYLFKKKLKDAEKD